MRYTQAEKLEIIHLVEQADVSVKQVLCELVQSQSKAVE